MSERKPVNPPKGWHFSNRFVDETGQIFEKGVYVGTVDGLENGEVPNEGNDQDKEVSVDEFVNSMSPELIQKLEERFGKAAEERMKKMMADFKKDLSTSSPASALDAEALAKALVKAQQYQSKGVFYKDVKDIDPADYDPVGCVFTSYGTGYVIVDDVRQGQPVKTPYGRIFVFKQNLGRITKIGPHAETYSALCVFHTRSKREIEWLKQHRKFGIEFFLDSKEALNANAYAAQILSAVNTEVRALDQSDILSRAKANGIELGGDLEFVIQKLVRKIAGDRIAKTEKAIQDRFREMSTDELFEGRGITI